MGGGVHDALRVLVITYAYALSDSRLQKICRWGKKKEGNPYPYLGENRANLLPPPSHPTFCLRVNTFDAFVPGKARRGRVQL